MEKFVNDSFNNKYVQIHKSGFTVFNTIQKRYKDKKNIAIIKTQSSSMLYLTTLENNERHIDFLNSGLITTEKLKNYDLIILENEYQDDNVFNPEDIVIRYTKENGNIIFKDNKELNCFIEHYKRDTNADNAVKRTCFTYYYFKNFKNLKLDFKETIKDEELEDINIYYYVNQINDK